ncbi:MAG: hypothetical protein COA79_04785 [Planctomycetota bacterium]|nr:MAG: hypothetical protein COA79_04785 [Planctomycetota bacterium]
MKTLIIGGSGNIGHGVILSLLEKSAEVTLFHRGKTTSQVNEIESIFGDRNNADELEKAISSQPFDIVIDLICQNKTQAEALVEICTEKVEHIILSSSVTTYGNKFRGRSILPTDMQKPEFEYSQNKLDCEKALFDASLEKKFNLTIMRLANIYGHGRLMPCQLSFKSVAWDRILNDQPILCSSDGQALTHITHITDIGNAFANACLNETCYQKAYHLVYEKCLTWNQYYNAIADSLEKTLKLIYAPKDILLELGNEKYDSTLGHIMGHHQYYDSTSTYRDIPEFEKTIPLNTGAKDVILNAKEKGFLPAWDSDTIYNQIVKHFQES